MDNSLVGLLDRNTGAILTEEAERFYGGQLGFPAAGADRPVIVSNFVTSVDGRVSYQIKGHEAGSDIAKHNVTDRALMALLRAVAGAVLVGGKTLQVEHSQLWTPEYVASDPAWAEQCTQLRRELGLPPTYLHFFVTGSGNIKGKPGDPDPKVLTDPQAETWFLTTAAGKHQLETAFPTLPLNILTFGDEKTVDMKAAVAYIRHRFGTRLLLCEGGPTVIGELLKHDLLDESFLTISPLITGPATVPKESDRPSWVNGFLSRPETSPSLELISAKVDRITGNYLFLRYRTRR